MLSPACDAEPTALTEMLARAGMPLNTRCGQRGMCEGCVVELLDGRLRGADGGVVEAGEAPLALRACEHEPWPAASAAIRVPLRSQLATQPQVLETFKLNVSRAHDPLWQRLEMPVHQHAVRDSHAYAQVAGDVHGGGWAIEPVVTSEPTKPRSIASLNGGTSEAVLAFAGDRWRVRPATASDPQRPLGAAIDLGTTTAVVMLVDLTSGRIVGRASDTNAQVRLGDNVLTRIERCMGDASAVRELQRAVVDETLRPALERALSAAGADAAELVCVVVAGNTTMLHLLAGIDPSPMGAVPFEPAFLEHRIVDADGLKLLPQRPSTERASEVPTHLLPGAAAYVGADVLAGALSTGLAYEAGPSVLVDVGTNGEIIARFGEKLIGCATAAGPAFEGGGLTSGMRAGNAAVAHVHFEGPASTLKLECIGGGPPAGLCGSAYIDLLAEGRRTGLIDGRGRINAGVAESIDLDVERGSHGLVLRIAQNDNAPDVLLTEADVAALLQAKAAIAAGITTLLERLAMRPTDVHRLYLAGGFGMHASTDHAIACGLLPGFTRQQVQVVGNTALAGAYLTLLDAGALAEMNRLRRRMEIVELNLDTAFESAFIDHLVLP